MKKIISKILPFISNRKLRDKEKHILIDMLSIGNEYLQKNNGVDYGILQCKLEEKGYSTDLIDKALKLYYPENFRYFHNEKSWLSSDGYIRLLQYESLKSSEENLIASKKNLSFTKRALYLAIIAMSVNIVIPFLPKPNSDATIQKQDCIIELLQQIESKHDSIIQSIQKIQESANPISNVDKDTTTVHIITNKLVSKGKQ